MHIDYTKLLPTQLRDTRWADILTVVGNILEDIKVDKIDIIKTQSQIMNMTDEQLISFALNFGYNITSLGGYTATLDYLRKEVYTIVPRILNRTTKPGYTLIFGIFNLIGNVYPTTYDGTTYLSVLEDWETSDESTLAYDTLDAGGDFILFYLPYRFDMDLISFDSGITYDAYYTIYDNPATTELSNMTLDNILWPTLDAESVLDNITRHIIIKYAFRYAENAAEFLSNNSLNAFYTDVLNQKRRTEVVYFEPIATIATYPAEIFSFKNFNAIVTAIAFHSDGSIIVTGNFTTYNDLACPTGICKLTKYGNIDTIFNSGIGFDASGINAISLQSDGKILVGGVPFTTYNGVSCSNCFCRLTSDGMLDTSFNSSGIGFNGTVWSIGIQSDGKILVGGEFTTYNGAACSAYLCRLNSDGSLDTSFNLLSGGFDDAIAAITIQSDGKIVVGGYFTTYTDTVGLRVQCPKKICRLNFDGTLDTTFNYGVNRGFSTSLDPITTITMQTDGKILVGGYFIEYVDSYGLSTNCPNCFCRLNTDGTLDTTFNCGVNRGFPVGSAITTNSLQSDGKILVSGYFNTYIDSTGTLTGCPNNFCRINTNGTLDTTFNYNNVGFDSYTTAVAFQSDSRLLVSGSFTIYNGVDCSNYLAIIDGDGNLKTNENIPTIETLHNHDHSISTSITSILIGTDLSDVSKIRFGNGVHSVIDISITDVNQFIIEVNITDCDVLASTATSLQGRRKITQKCTFPDVSELALFDSTNACIYYATFPKISFYKEMYSNIAFNISLI